ncbi:hypothetical protein [Arthrobacter sp. UYCo732]|uniref:hypothetical protein n=1 Tax=Arthrobacter sp. UYCo732 TaxID=3156336 RepID=UPI0033977B70
MTEPTAAFALSPSPQRIQPRLPGVDVGQNVPVMGLLLRRQAQEEVVTVSRAHTMVKEALQGGSRDPPAEFRHDNSDGEGWYPKQLPERHNGRALANRVSASGVVNSS